MFEHTKMRNIYLEIVVFLLFHALRIVWNCVLIIMWHLNGTAQKLRFIQDPSKYEQCAQILDIVEKYNFDVITLPNSAKHFLVKHNRFTHPSYVLKDEVTLYCINKDAVIFVEAPSGIDVNQLKNGSFHKQAQFNHAIQLISIPHYAFHRLASEVGDPKAQLVFLEFQPRSGSTLMCQIFEATGQCVTFSEGDLLSIPFSEQMTKAEQTLLVDSLHSAIRLVCKPKQNGDQVSFYLFRSLPTDLYIDKLVPTLKTLYPTSKFLFIYREIKESVHSMRRMAAQVNTARLLYTIERIYPKYVLLQASFIVESGQIPETVKEILTNRDSMTVFGYILMSGYVQRYIRQYTDNPTTLQKPAIKYEHIINNPEHCIKIIFDYCGVPRELVPLGLKGMEIDSQKNSHLKRANLPGQQREPEESVIAELDTIARLLKVPKYGEEILVPNTITAPT